MIGAALSAESQVLLKMNVPKDALDSVTRVLPALHAPTVNSLSEDGWFGVETVIKEGDVRDLIPLLKKSGAEGIIELGLNKVVS